MDNKLEERLREFSKWHRTSFYGIPDYGVLADRAADEITRLNALVDEMREMIGEAVEDHDSHNGEAIAVNHWTNRSRALITKASRDS